MKKEERPVIRMLCFSLFALVGQMSCAEEKHDAVSTSRERELNAKAQSLCFDKEQIIFTCKIKRRVASICASDNFANGTGSMQYRYGRIGKPEITVPEKSGLSQSAVGYKIFEQANGSTASYIRFSQGSYKYYVYSVSIRGENDPQTGTSTWIEPSGVHVTKAGHIVYSKKCTSTNLVLWQSQALWINRIPELGPSEDDIDPEAFSASPKR